LLSKIIKYLKKRYPPACSGFYIINQNKPNIHALKTSNENIQII